MAKNNIGLLKQGLMYIGLLLSVVTCFLGTLHYFEGEKIMAIILTLLLTFCIYFLIVQLIRKKEELKKNSSLNKNLSFFLYFIYLVLALPLSFFSIHGLNVELNAKKEVKKSYSNVKIELDNKTSNFDTKLVELNDGIRYELQDLLSKGKYADMEKSVQDTLIKKYNINEALINSTSHNIIRDEKLKDIKDDIKTSQKKIDDDHVKTILKNSAYIEKWNLFNLHQAMLQVDSNMRLLKQKTEKNFNSAAAKYSGKTKLELKDSKRENDLAKPLELLKKHNAYILILIAILQHCLLLASLLFTVKSVSYGNKKVQGGITIN